MKNWILKQINKFGKGAELTVSFRFGTEHVNKYNVMALATLNNYKVTTLFAEIIMTMNIKTSLGIRYFKLSGPY